MIIMFISCQNDSKKTAQELWKDGKEFRKDNNLKEAINTFKLIINNNPDDIYAPQSQFQIADIFLNDTKDYEFALKEFKIFLEKYPNHKDAKKSLFMVAYINNNYINAFSDAIFYYNLFKEKYPDDELIPSVVYELKGLQAIKNQIDSLNSTIVTNPNL